MSRIDVQTLVLAFEKRISELNKNPPDLVPASTIKLLLENAVQEEIEKHFTNVVKKEIVDLLNKEFKNNNKKLIREILKNIMTDSHFKETIQEKIKKSIIKNIL